MNGEEKKKTNFKIVEDESTLTLILFPSDSLVIPTSIKIVFDKKQNKEIASQL